MTVPSGMQESRGERFYFNFIIYHRNVLTTTSLEQDGGDDVVRMDIASDALSDM